jgi:hypothetical protein
MSRVSRSCSNAHPFFFPWFLCHRTTLCNTTLGVFARTINDDLLFAMQGRSSSFRPDSWGD